MVKLTLLTDEESLEHTFKTHEHLSSPAVSVGSTSDVDSLFDEPMDNVSPKNILDGIDTIPSAYTEPPHPLNVRPASRLCPQIPGLYFDPSVLLPDQLAETLLQKCLETYFQNSRVNQVMLFERAVSSGTRSSDTPGTSCHNRTPPAAHTHTTLETASQPSSLPPFLKDLLSTLAEMLRPVLPPHTHLLLFPPPDSPPQARQVIVNFYRPGEGISPHVDLLDRFNDGIVGVSLGSGCAMRFRPARAHDSATRCPAETLGPVDGTDESDRAHEVFLPHGSVYVMSEEARYGWTHGIDGRREDWVQDRVGSDAGRWVVRSIRVSITFRWLLPGADVVGGLPDAVSSY